MLNMHVKKHRLILNFACTQEADLPSFEHVRSHEGGSELSKNVTSFGQARQKIFIPTEKKCEDNALVVGVEIGRDGGGEKSWIYQKMRLVRN